MKLEEFDSIKVEEGCAAFLRLNNYTGVAIKHPHMLILIDPDIPPPKQAVNPGLILISHSHPRHFTPAYIAGLAGKNTRIATTSGVAYRMRRMRFRFPHNLTLLQPGEKLELGDVVVEAHSGFHPYKAVVPGAAERFASLNEGQWGERHLSFALNLPEFGRVYHMSDSILLSPLRKVGRTEIAVVPVNLEHWNSAERAAEAVALLQPRKVLALTSMRGGLLDRWSARRERKRFAEEMKGRGIVAEFLEVGVPVCWQI